MRNPGIHLEILLSNDMEKLKGIDRSDISVEFVDTLETLVELTSYGEEHHCIGHTFAVCYGERIVGTLLLGEGISWSIDPPELDGIPFYRLMGFVIDKNYRNLGIGTSALEQAIQSVYAEYGSRPVLLGCQEDNEKGLRFYERLGFIKTESRDEDDIFMIRYPEREL